MQDFNRKYLGQEVGQAIQATLALRELLRERTVVELAAEIGNYLSKTWNILTIIESYALQKNQTRITGLVAEFKDFLGQLAVDCRESGDNVRCMDRLQYQILPSLQKLRKFFEK